MADSQSGSGHKRSWIFPPSPVCPGPNLHAHYSNHLLPNLTQGHALTAQSCIFPPPPPSSSPFPPPPQAGHWTCMILRTAQCQEATTYVSRDLKATHILAAIVLQYSTPSKAPVSRTVWSCQAPSAPAWNVSYLRTVAPTGPMTAARRASRCLPAASCTGTGTALSGRMGAVGSKVVSPSAMDLRAVAKSGWGRSGGASNVMTLEGSDRAVGGGSGWRWAPVVESHVKEKGSMRYGRNLR